MFSRKRSRGPYYDAVLGRQLGDVTELKFAKRLCGHRSLISRLHLDARLKGHAGCVNTVTFSPDGQYAITGSDDTRLMLWDVNTAQRKLSLQSAHVQNIFSARILPCTDNDEVVSCAADGQVRWTKLSAGTTKLLARHGGRAHRLCLVPGSSSHFMSCAEDGMVYGFDLRSQRKRGLLSLVDDDGDAIRIYAMSVNPVNANYFVLGGTSTLLHLYDARMSDDPVARFAPKHLRGTRNGEHVTGTAYDWSGQHVVATYNDEHIYRFDVSLDAIKDGEQRPSPPAQNARGTRKRARSGAAGGSPSCVRGRSEEDDDEVSEKAKEQGEDGEGDGVELEDEAEARGGKAAAEAEELSGGRDGEDDVVEDGGKGYRSKYWGHRNDRTVKNVSFFGPRSEYVVSGSDCGHIFIWETDTSELVSLLYGDSRGAINCLESHPSEPLLATSGLEHDAKFWRPIKPQAAARGSLRGKRGIAAQELMEDNERGRREPHRGMSLWASVLLNQALHSGAPVSDVRALLALLRGPLAALDTDESGEEGDARDEDEGGGDATGSASDSSSSSDAEDEDAEDEVGDEDVEVEVSSFASCGGNAEEDDDDGDVPLDSAM